MPDEDNKNMRSRNKVDRELRKLECSINYDSKKEEEGRREEVYSTGFSV